MESISSSDANGVPPALPEKRSKRRKERQPSQYDNVPENEHLSTCSLHTNNGDSSDASKPPPLPLKKRHSKSNHKVYNKQQQYSNTIMFNTIFSTIALLLLEDLIIMISIKNEVA